MVNHYTQEIRIIGGKYRGKKIPVLDSAGLRPSPNRVRETLFNWVMHEIAGARCLDAFAGSGALGLEAYSRGAAEVVFLEESKLVFKQLQQTLVTFFDNCSTTHATPTFRDLFAESSEMPSGCRGQATARRDSGVKCQHTLLHTDALAYLQQAQKPFDLIFLDPPFGSQLLPACLATIADNHLLKPDGLVYLESGEPITVDEKIWTMHKQKKAGQVWFGLYLKQPQDLP